MRLDVKALEVLDPFRQVGYLDSTDVRMSRAATDVRGAISINDELLDICMIKRIPPVLARREFVLVKGTNR